MSKLRITTRWRGWQSNNASDGERSVTQAPTVSVKVSGTGPDFTLKFGKYAGVKVGDLPVDYLQWMAGERNASWAVDEIIRRDGRTPSPKKSSPQHNNVVNKKHVIAERQRLEALEHVRVMQAGIDIVGTEYPRLLTEFNRSVGDPDECPFDTDSYTYTGPSIYRGSGQPVIGPGEFPREFI